MRNLLDLRNGQRMRARFLLALLPFSLGSQLLAEEVFDNLSIACPVFFGCPAFYGGDTAEQRLGQQFILGSNDTVTSVTVKLKRNGSPTGRIDVEIWDDSGSGTPGQAVGTVGSIEDLSLIQPAPTLLSFDAAVTGLSPNAPHYIVLSFLQAMGTASDNIAWIVVEETNGTNGAINAQATETGTMDWVSLIDIGPGPPPVNSAFFKMAVTVIPEPSAFVLGVTGLAALLLPFRQRRK